jgi:hypothetical protein
VSEDKRKRWNTEGILIKSIAEASKDIAGDFQPFWRPLVRLITVIVFSLIVIISTPFTLIARLLPRKQDSFQKLRTELETVWHEKSSIEALHQLRELRSTLYNDHLEALLNKGVEIQPYGVFKFAGYSNVLQLLYHYELRHKNYTEAGGVCDEIIKPYVGKEGKRWLPEEWFVNKAKTIAALEGSTAAQEFLMPYVDNDNEESFIRKYFLELRGEQV